MKLKSNINQDGNTFYIHDTEQKLICAVEMNMKVPDFDIGKAQIAREWFLRLFPQYDEKWLKKSAAVIEQRYEAINLVTELHRDKILTDYQYKTIMEGL